MQSKIQINDLLPDGLLAGFTAEGRVVVCIEFAPVYGVLMGTAADQDSVTEWHVCEAHARRLAWTAAWNNTGHQCSGVMQ